MDNLEQALRRLADEPVTMPGAARIEALLLERFDRRSRFPWVAAIGLALAGCLAVTGFFQDVRGRQSTTVQSVFLAIPYTIGPAPYERTTVVRMDIPVSALVAAGFRVYTADTSASIAADVLLGQDDRALAIRPVESIFSAKGE